MEPFVKWAGGKRQLLDLINSKTPSSFETYYEPFVGGGAVLFYLKPQKAIISDVNEQLINVYIQLQKNPKALIKKIEKFDKTVCDKEYYLSMRDQYNQKISNKELDIDCAAYMIWINKHCFNGLYRVNKKGLFNVPWNNKQNGPSFNVENLISIGDYLQKNDITILCEDFENACKDIQENDFVYFDSPYIPVSKTASFTDYTKDGFTYEDHVRLSKLYKRLSNKNVKAMLSNHDSELIYELYSDYKIESFTVKRFINSKATKRTGKEVIITNYEI